MEFPCVKRKNKGERCSKESERGVAVVGTGACSTAFCYCAVGFLFAL